MISSQKLWLLDHEAGPLRHFYGQVLHTTTEHLYRTFEIKREDVSSKEIACPVFCGDIWQLSTLENRASGNYTQTKSLDLFNSESALYKF
jgi:hypothetical protein